MSELRKTKFLKLNIVIFVCLMIITSLFIKVGAKQTEFIEPITDETCITDDLNVLGVDTSSYKVSSKTIGFNKIYVVAVGESYNPSLNEIAIYLYFFIPFNYLNVEDISFVSVDYKLNSETLKSFSFDNVKWNDMNYDSEKQLFKIKAFSINDFKTFNLSITNISYSIGEEENKCSSDFKCNVSCNFIQSDNMIHYYILSDYDKTIIIDDIQVVKIRLKDKNLWNGWNDFWDRLWTDKTDYFDFYFYNFNMPDDIKYDDIVYSKFNYDYYKVEGAKNTVFSMIDEYENIVSIESKEKEYYAYDMAGHKVTKTCNINNESVEMTLPIFYLGNRVLDSQFGELTRLYETSDIDSKLFDYDCSILLDTTSAQTQRISRSVMGQAMNVGYYYVETKFDNIELLELNYKYDGKEYECQVVSKVIDDSEVEKIEPKEKNDFYDFMNDFIELFNSIKNSDLATWFVGNFPNSLYLIIMIIILLPIILSFMPNIIVALFKLIVKFVTLPLKALKLIIKRN